MANEGVIKINYFDDGEVDITCKILKPDDTVRDAQTDVALDDAGHVNLYTNDGAITIEAGDSVIPYKGGVNINAAFEYIPEVTVVGFATEAKQDEILGNFFPDEVFDPTSGTIRYNKKGTVTQLSKKDLKDPSGNAVDSTEDIIAEATEQ